MKNLEIFACDIGNECLNTKCYNNLYNEAVAEFESEKGMMTIIAREIWPQEFWNYMEEKIAETLN